MKQFLMFFVAIMPIVCAGIYLSKPIPTPIQTQQFEPIQEVDGEIHITDITQEKIPDIIEKINKINGQIRSIACDDIIIKIWQNGMRIRLTGELYYEKEKNFHFTAKSILGKEIELGSNDDYFWFWSKRMEMPALYFASHADYYKTRLKTPFDPKLMQQSMAINPIDVKSSKIVEKQDRYIILDNLTNSVGQPIIKLTYINKVDGKFIGFLIIDKKGNNIVSSEVVEWENSIPKQIMYVWFDEKISMLIDIKSIKINANINKNNWNMPNITPKVDMGKDNEG